MHEEALGFSCVCFQKASCDRRLLVCCPIIPFAMIMIVFAYFAIGAAMIYTGQRHTCHQLSHCLSLCFHCRPVPKNSGRADIRRLRRSLCLVIALPSWLRHCLSLQTYTLPPPSLSFSLPFSP